MSDINWIPEQNMPYPTEYAMLNGVEAEVSKRAGKNGWHAIVKPTSEVCEYPELWSFDIAQTQLAARNIAITQLRRAAQHYKKVNYD